MAWTYCSACDSGVDQPTPQQVVEGNYTCPHCGEHLDPNMSLGDVVLNLLERIEALEGKNAKS